MLSNIVIPSFGATGGDVLIDQWLVAEGDFVEAGQPILVASTDKATVDIEAFRQGYIRKILLAAGGTAAIGQSVAILTDSLDEPLETGVPDSALTATGASTDSPASAPAVPGASPALSTTAPRQVAPPDRGRIQASPLARRLAKEHGVDLAAIASAYAGRPVHGHDVLAAVTQPGAASTGAELLAKAGELERIAATPMRRAIAERTVLSKSQVPHFYAIVEIDMTAAQAMRQELPGAAKAADQTRPSITDLALQAAARALRDVPALNASYQQGQIVRYRDINIGLVVGLPEGMLIPVVRRADQLSLCELMAATRRLRQKAAAGSLAQSELSGGTFTLSNLGMFGVDSFIAVIQPPEAAILALGAVRPQPVVVAGEIVVRSMMTATLSADHRVADGITAARFLSRFRELLETPDFPEIGA